MRTTTVVYYVGFILALIGLFMLVSAVVGAIYRDDSILVLTMSGFMVLALGIFPLIFIPRTSKINIREAILIVSGTWIIVNIFGAIPFYLYGFPFTYANALFESFSGFTTTGASILEYIERIPKGLLFWRSLTNWIGGVGIIMFALAILPRLGQVSSSLVSKEYSNLAVVQVKPRSINVVRIIVFVYVALTCLETIALLAAGVNFFEALTTSFGTIATGGFSPRDGSIAAYNSLAVEMIVLFFMIVSGINFATLYIIIFSFLKERSVLYTAKIYIVLLISGVLAVTLINMGYDNKDFWTALRYASFQVCSVGSSTGFATADSAVWSIPSQQILIFFSLICACSGSTSGGIKVDRIILFYQMFKWRIRQLIHPSIVISIKSGRRTIDVDEANKAVFIIVLYLAIIGVSTFLATTMGVELLEAYSGTVAVIGNVGPGLGKLGAMGNYNYLPDSVKILFCLVMLIGRLEILGFLLPFTKYFWRK